MKNIIFKSSILVLIMLIFFTILTFSEVLTKTFAQACGGRWACRAGYQVTCSGGTGLACGEFCGACQWVCAACPPSYSSPPVGYGTPPYGTPNYNTTGYHFKDFQKDSSFDTSDIGISGLSNTLYSGSGVLQGSQNTNSEGGYLWYAMPNATWRIDAGGSVCGWHYKDPSVTYTISGDDRIINFPLWPNDPGNLILQGFSLRDSTGAVQTIFDPGQWIYAYTSSNNAGANEPYTNVDYIQGAIDIDSGPSKYTNSISLTTAANPDNFYFQRNLCWAAGAQYRTGSKFTGAENPNDWPSVNRYQTYTPGTYNARAFLDFRNKVNEGGTTALEYTDNQIVLSYNVRNYIVQGNVFLDTDGDGNKDPLENNYTGTNATITESAIPVATSNASGTYSISNRRTGAKTWRLTPPSGYTITGPTSYSINFNNGAYTVSPNTGTLPQGPVSPGGAVGNTSTTLINVNFGISQSNSWIQTVGLSSRFDRGLPMANIPATANTTYGVYAMKAASTSGSTPGIMLSGSENIPFPVSFTWANYKAGGTSYPEVFNKRLFPLKTSYTYLMSKFGSQAVELSSATGGCSAANYNNCTLTTAFRPGIYKVTGAHLNLNDTNFVRQSGEPASPRDYIFLIDGNLVVKGVMRVGPDRTLLFSAKGDVVFQQYVGRTPSTYTSTQKASDLGGVEGFYVAGDDIRISSYGACPQSANPDLQLFVDGSLVANSQGGDGFIDNKRTLCASNNIYPSVVVRSRPDLILMTPSSLKQNPFIWREVAP